MVAWSRAGHTRCTGCGTQRRKHHCRGLCDRCRKRADRRGSTDYTKSVPCRRCQRPRRLKARGMCTSCYFKAYYRREWPGRRCPHPSRPRHALGMCKPCWRRHRYKGLWPRWLTHCLDCMRPKAQIQHRASGLCSACHRRATIEGRLGVFRARFQALKVGQHWPGHACLILVQSNGLAWLAGHLKADQSAVRSWVRWSGNPNPQPVPSKHRPALRKLWEQMEQ